MGSRVLALDIGGANLKAAQAGGTILQPFELWKRPGDLPEALRQLLRRLLPSDVLAVTMTGELCDCFASKRQGVHAILDAVEAVAGSKLVRVWSTDGQLWDIRTARVSPLKVAAANWLALATYASRLVPVGSALLIDVGSTTTDVIPLHDGRPAARGRTDPERLRSGELLYTGVRRTPVCALLGAEGAAEFFATTLDVYLLTDDLPEQPEDRRTADGRPATRAAARARLARMVCGDEETCTPEEVVALARRLARRQRGLLASAVTKVSALLPERPRAMVTAGSGEFLARATLRELVGLAALPVCSLAEQFDPEVSQAACAFALMILAQEEVNGR